MGDKLTGLDEVRRRLAEAQQRLESLSGPLSFEELFPPPFMLRYTDFPTIDDMVAASGHDVRTTEDFEAIPEAEWNDLVRARTRFQDWDAMRAKAGEELADRRLNPDTL
jgi:hypothetical protein